MVDFTISVVVFLLYYRNYYPLVRFFPPSVNGTMLTIPQNQKPLFFVSISRFFWGNWTWVFKDRLFIN